MFHQNNRMGYKTKKNHRKNGKSRCASTFTSYLTPPPFSKGCRGLIHLSTIQDSFLHNYYNWGNQDPALKYYDRKDTLQDQVLLWREKPVLAQAERARSPSGNPENYFWASSSSHLFTQHTQTTIVLTSKWRKRRPVAHRRIGDCCRDSSSFRPGLLPRCDAVHRDPDTRETEISSQR